jgi:hypothetical protein
MLLRSMSAMRSHPASFSTNSSGEIVHAVAHEVVAGARAGGGPFGHLVDGQRARA